jgi:excisionase family DNA binding protein
MTQADIGNGAEREALWDIHDLAGYLNVAESSAYALVASGRIPALRLTSRLRFEPEAVKRALREGAK